jgi:zinc transport system ATP-binding protein
MSAAVEVSDVTFAYAERPVIESVSLEVAEGEFLGLVGPNGSGKTTLLELMIGLRRPDSGTIRLFGEDPRDFEEGERVGYVPQDVTSSKGKMPVTVREVVRMGRYPHRTANRS